MHLFTFGCKVLLNPSDISKKLSYRLITSLIPLQLNDQVLRLSAMPRQDIDSSNITSDGVKSTLDST
jgi:hypothetical protein